MTGVPNLSNACQVGAVVRDLKAAMDHYSGLGVGPFKVYVVDTGTLGGVTYRGKAGSYVVQAAFAQMGSVQLELLEHLRGESIYKDFLVENGEGLHHLGVDVDDRDAARDELLGWGFESMQSGPISGKDRDGWFEYFDTRKELGIILEILCWPDIGEEPTYMYP